MNPIATYAEEYLESHPFPALRLSEILAPVADRVDRTLTVRRLRRALSEHPDRFRLLDPWQGAWRVPEPSSPRLTALEEEHDGEVWVVLLSEPGRAATSTGSGANAAEPLSLMRECVRWLARSVDPRSPMSVSRWYAMALAERDTRRALVRHATRGATPEEGTPE